MSEIDDILEPIFDEYTIPKVRSEVRRKFRKMLLDKTEEIAWQDPADGSWLIEPKQLRDWIRKP